MPKTINLSNVKILWSQEKETAEMEQARKAKAEKERAANKKRLLNLVNFGKKCQTKVETDLIKAP